MRESVSVSHGLHLSAERGPLCLHSQAFCQRELLYSFSLHSVMLFISTFTPSILLNPTSYHQSSPHEAIKDHLFTLVSPSVWSWGFTACAVLLIACLHPPLTALISPDLWHLWSYFIPSFTLSSCVSVSPQCVGNILYGQFIKSTKQTMTFMLI